VTLDRVVAATVSAALFLVAALAFFRRDREDVATHGTIGLFALVWAISLGVFAIPWIKYTRTDDLAWAAIYGSCVSFLLACFIAEQIAKPPDSVVAHERLLPRRLHVAMIATALLGYIGFAFFLRAINNTVGWTTLFTNLQAARNAQGGNEFAQQYGTVKVLTYFSGVALLLWTLAVRERAFNGRWRFVAPLGIFILAPYFFIGERLSLLTVAMWIAAFHLLWRPPSSARRVGAVAVIATATALGFFLLIGYHKGATIQNHPELSARLTTHSFEQLALPYLYLTANVPVFSKLTEDPIAPRTYGALTFWPAAKLSNLALRRSDYPPKYGAFYNIPFDDYNSATWLGPFYLDFGVAGCLVMAALFGLATTWLVEWARRRRTLLTVWLGALGLMIIAFSPLKNAFADANTWEYILAAPLVSRFVTRRSSTGEDLGGRSPRGRLLHEHPVLIAIGLAVIAALVAATLTLRLTTAPQRSGSSASDIGDRLSRAGEKLRQIYEREGYSSPHALASRLAVSDPSSNYVGYSALGEIPPTGVIGVSSGEHEFRLHARTRNGKVLEVVGVARNSKYRLVGPRVLRPGLVVNSGFEDQLGPSWVISSKRSVHATTTTDALAGAYSLSLRYRRPNGGLRSSVTQIVERLPARAPGTRYTLSEIVRTRNLSRQVTCGLQLIYRDATTLYIAGTAGSQPPQKNTRATGLLAGSQEFERLVASGVAAKPVRAVRIFVVDAGSAPLQGAIVVDDVELTITRSAARR
jgi:oligosaccharide repeat unit polymerase